MSRLGSCKLLAYVLLAAFMCKGASAADVDGCTRFTRDVARELAVMKQTPQAVSAATKPKEKLPQINDVPMLLRAVFTMVTSSCTMPNPRLKLASVMERANAARPDWRVVAARCTQPARVLKQRPERFSRQPTRGGGQTALAVKIP